MRTTWMRRGPVALGLLVLAGCGSSAGGAGSAGSSPASSGEGAANAVLRTADSPLGPIAVAANGRTVYVFDEDGVGASTCAGSCAALWPALSAETQEPAVDGVPGDVGTITRDDGTLQVTLDGMPLYTYAGDSDAGDVTGQGVDGVWWVVAADGAEVTDAPGSAPAPGY